MRTNKKREALSHAQQTRIKQNPKGLLQFKVQHDMVQHNSI
jgi:hypothetical protein